MNRKTRLLAAAAAAALVAQSAPSVLAQQSQTQQNQAQQQQDQQQQQQVAEQDQQFANEAAAANKAELELAQLAQEQASSEEVKKYAQTLVDDHTQAGDELQRIAEEQGITLEAEMPQEVQQAKEQLSGQSGAAFDRAFVEQMVTDHEKAIQLYEDEAQNGENEALKQFASSIVETLRGHLETARELEGQIGQQQTAGAQEQGQQMQQDQTQQAEQMTQAQDNPLMQMTGSELLGKTVVNQQGEEVGEIEDIVINRQDKVVQAVVSVGGFLGIGAKSVAVPFDQLQPGQEDNILLSSGATVEELKQRPAYDEASGDYERVPEDRTPADTGL